jgi:hypothetical protein
LTVSVMWMYQFISAPIHPCHAHGM